jgi:hypothetical protein
MSKRAHEEEEKSDTKRAKKESSLESANTYRVIADFHRAQELCPDLNLSVPLTIIIGDQAVGKSSLVRRLIGFNLVPARAPDDDINKIETVCPIFIDSSRSSDSEYRLGIELFRIDGTKVDLFKHQVVDKENACKQCGEWLKLQIQEHSAGNNTLSHISLRFSGPDVNPGHLMDLPGLSHDKKDLAAKINKAIGDALKKYKRHIVVLMTDSSSAATSTAAWEFVHESQRSKSVWVGTKPDKDLRNAPMLKILESNKGFGGVPNENIFLFKGDLEDEKSWFSTTAPYMNSMHASHFGIENITKRLEYLVGEQLKEQLMPIREQIALRYKVNREKLGSLQVVDYTSLEKRLFTYLTISSEYIQKLNNSIRSSGKRMQELMTLFRDGSSTRFKEVSYGNGLSDKQIEERIHQSTGLDSPMLGYSNEIVVELLFGRANSPSESIGVHVEQLVLSIKAIFLHHLRELVDSMVQLQTFDQKFKNAFVQTICDVVEEGSFQLFFLQFIEMQKYNYDKFDTKKPDSIRTLEYHWNSIVEGLMRNFPRAARSHFVEFNIKRIEKALTSDSTRESLSKLISMNPDVERQRNILIEQNTTLKTALDSSSSYLVS